MVKPDPSLVCVAAIRGAFGVRGEVRIESFTEEPEACFSYGPLLDETGAAALTVESWRPLKKGFGATIAEDLSREALEAMKGERLYIPRAVLPETGEDEFYLSDLEGLEVRHVDGRTLGRVKRVADFGGGDLVEIKGEGPSWFLPFTKEYAPGVDLKAGVIEVDPPEGLEPGSEG